MELFIRFLQANELPQLRIIDLSHNLLTEKGAIPFIQTLVQKQIRTLEVVDLSYNQLSDHFSQALLEVFVTSNSSCSIKSILFEGNPFSPEVMQQMKCIYGGKN